MWCSRSVQRLEWCRVRTFRSIQSSFASYTSPDAFSHRLRVWERARVLRDDVSILRSGAMSETIVCRLPDGSERVFPASRTPTPYDVARDVSASLAKKSVVARVDGVLWDLKRPLEGSCSLELFPFDSEPGRQVFWHSSAHLLGEAIEQRFPTARLCDGPATDAGFFYDVDLGGDSVDEEDLRALENLVETIASQAQPFERLAVDRKVAQEMFAENPHKLEMLQNIPSDQVITVYRCGPFIDLCRGPHLPHTGYIKGVRISRSSAVHVSSSENTPTGQRIFGITFPSKKELVDYEHLVEERKRRDHRIIGRQQELFFFSDLSPGSAFFSPNGTYIFNGLVNFMKEKLRVKGYDEVISPVLFKRELWQTSGHWDNYRENMFSIATSCGSPSSIHFLSSSSDTSKEKNNDEELGVKPMNCPGHCVLYKSRSWSYRDLPIRWADFSPLHRNEATGALSGLTRLRRFHQDDGHIFCRPDQIRDEIRHCLELVNDVYSVFDMETRFKLSTRPEDKFVGDIESWNRAEDTLRECLNEYAQGKWDLNPGDGAFYGPKIDILVTDALMREHQCATIQLDFQLPRRFELQYVDDQGHRQQPVLIHRAVLGSVERFFAILTEHIGGKWPLWLSPRQCCVVPVTREQQGYAMEISSLLRSRGYRTEVADGSQTLSKNVRNAQLAQVNYILVIGRAELEHNTINVRTRDNEVHGEMRLDELERILSEEITSRSLTSKFS